MQRKPIDRNVHHSVIYMHTCLEITHPLNIKIKVSYDIPPTEYV